MVSFDELLQDNGLTVSQETYDELKETLLNSTSLSKRFRALFTLKSIKTVEAVSIIALGFTDPSALLRHELAYVLGQMKCLSALPILETVLATDRDEMVRHEAAEAMGAIGALQSIPILQSYLNDPSEAVVQTCLIALDSISHGPFGSSGGYGSIDPAPPMSGSVEKCSSVLMDGTLSLFKRYRAMFTLRNLHTPESVLALAQGFNDPSALFRHEIAYVFGQMQDPLSIPALEKVLSNHNEHPMVRHEAAEALGSIGSPETFEILGRFKNDEAIVVKESCMIGLDMCEFEQSGDFQYAQSVEIL